MCKGIDYCQQLTDILANIINDHNILNKQFSKINMEQQDLLHYIENDNLSASQGYIYSKALQEVRKKRRVIKNELDILENLKKSFVDKHYNNLKSITGNLIKENEKLQLVLINKTYSPRVISKEDVKLYCVK